ETARTDRSYRTRDDTVVVHRIAGHGRITRLSDVALSGVRGGLFRFLYFPRRYVGLVRHVYATGPSIGDPGCRGYHSSSSGRGEFLSRVRRTPSVVCRRGDCFSAAHDPIALGAMVAWTRADPEFSSRRRHIHRGTGRAVENAQYSCPQQSPKI